MLNYEAKDNWNNIYPGKPILHHCRSSMHHQFQGYNSEHIPISYNIRIRNTRFKFTNIFPNEHSIHINWSNTTICQLLQNQGLYN